MKNSFVARRSPEIVVIALLIVWNGVVWFASDADLISPRFAAILAGIADALAIPILSVRTLLSDPNRFGIWHLYSALAAGSFGVYGFSALAELDDPVWVGNVLMALVVVKVGLLAMWIGI